MRPKKPSEFPFRAKLLTAPESRHPAQFVRVGGVYTVYGKAGSCFIVSTDRGEDPRHRILINKERFEKQV